MGLSSPRNGAPIRGAWHVKEGASRVHLDEVPFLSCMHCATALGPSELSSGRCVVSKNRIDVDFGLVQLEIVHWSSERADEGEYRQSRGRTLYVDYSQAVGIDPRPQGLMHGMGSCTGRC
jgi:hypothetical protein